MAWALRELLRYLRYEWKQNGSLRSWGYSLPVRLRADVSRFKNLACDLAYYNLLFLWARVHTTLSAAKVHTILQYGKCTTWDNYLYEQAFANLTLLSRPRVVLPSLRHRSIVFHTFCPWKI